MGIVEVRGRKSEMQDQRPGRDQTTKPQDPKLPMMSYAFLCIPMQVLCTFYAVSIRFLYRLGRDLAFSTRRFPREYRETGESFRPQKNFRAAPSSPLPARRFLLATPVHQPATRRMSTRFLLSPHSRPTAVLLRSHSPSTSMLLSKTPRKQAKFANSKTRRKFRRGPISPSAACRCRSRCRSRLRPRSRATR